jgi:hypothetical protein
MRSRDRIQGFSRPGFAAGLEVADIALGEPRAFGHVGLRKTFPATQRAEQAVARQHRCGDLFGQSCILTVSKRGPPLVEKWQHRRRLRTGRRQRRQVRRIRRGSERSVLRRKALGSFEDGSGSSSAPAIRRGGAATDVDRKDGDGILTQRSRGRRQCAGWSFAADQLFDVALPPDGAGVDTIRHAPARVLRERRGPWQRHGQVTAFMGRIATDI